MSINLPRTIIDKIVIMWEYIPLQSQELLAPRVKCNSFTCIYVHWYQFGCMDMVMFAIASILKKCACMW